MSKRPDMIGNRLAVGNQPNRTSFKKGVVSWNKGKSPSEETRKKMSEARKKLYLSGFRHPLLGKKRADIVGTKNPNWNKFGKEHPKWTDDKKRPFYKSIRQLFKYIEWRKSVFLRDNFTCVLCGTNKTYIEADHHPKRFVDIIRDNNVQSIEDALMCDELWDVSKGRTLCRPCHRKTNTWGRTKGLEKTVH